MTYCTIPYRESSSKFKSHPPEKLRKEAATKFLRIQRKRPAINSFIVKLMLKPLQDSTPPQMFSS